MSSIDIRNEGNEEIDSIVFADSSGEDGFPQANNITQCNYDGVPYICIENGDCIEIVINTKEHVLNLIKALNKAIELGWVK